MSPALEFYGTIEIVVLGKIDAPESSLAETPDNPVAPNFARIDARNIQRRPTSQVQILRLRQIVEIVHWEDQLP
jgi:hypothetical protein